MTHRIRAESGVSLAEALVAITVLALASTAAMMLYSGARRSYKVGSNLTEQQQNVRIAFDELTQDLRLVGYNVHPDTNRHRPDEQIELAETTAIVIRADYDAGDPAAALDPEQELADTANGSSFYTVSTGNDEVRAYVLANEDSDESLMFQADLGGSVRDGQVEPIEIAGISMSQQDPPYTLYRITWDASGGEVREPLVDQISTLRFVYYDERGQVVDPVPGEDDLAGVNAQARASIRRVGLEIEGMTRDADLRWAQGVAVAGESGTHRRFNLAADVTPRNLGLFGVRDLDAFAQPPHRPPPPSLYEGHCGGFWAEWAPNPPQDEVARYELRFGTATDDLSQGPVYAEIPEVYLGGLADNTEYYVSVTAVDDSGSPSLPSAPAMRRTKNINVPEAVAEAVATTDLEGMIVLNWSPVTENTASVPQQDPLAPRMRDAAGYRIYRDTDPDVELDDDHLAMEFHPGPSHDDVRVVNCRPYYYRVRALDECGAVGEASDAAAGASVYTTAPMAPPGLQAFWVSGTPIRLEWSPVTQDVLGRPILIKDYKIYRYQGPAGLTDFSAVPFSLFDEIDTGATSWQTPDDISASPVQSYFYVIARDDCINESERSDIVAQGTCVFTGEVVIEQPLANQLIPDAAIWLRARVDNGAGAYSIEFRVTRFATGQVVHQEVVSSPGVSQWNAAGDPSGSYRIEALAEQQMNGCEESASIFVTKSP